MILSYLSGLGTGIVLSVLLGTVFFALIETSVERGYKYGMWLSSGVILSDALMLTLAIFGTALLPSLQKYDTITTSFGSVLLTFLGITSIVSKPSELGMQKSGTGQVFYNIGKGFFLNILNPVNLLTWIAAITYVRAKMHYSLGELMWYGCGALTAIFGMETLISISAAKLKQRLNAKVIRTIKVVSGMAFIAFAVKLLYSLL